MVKMWSYNPWSESGKLLAQALGVKRIKHTNSKYKWKPHKRILNWGSTKSLTGQIINHPVNVRAATDKLSAFQIFQMRSVSVPPFTTHQNEAQTWLDNGKTVLARTVVNGAEGRGIIVVKPGDILPYAPLYTQYIPKKAEYRVHVVNNEAIDVQQKLRKRGHDNKDFHVRNTANGFIFVRGNVHCPEPCILEATKAVAALGLDFGAVDVIWNEKNQKAYVLEVNTAPGIVGTTVQKYKDALSALLHM